MDLQKSLTFWTANAPAKITHFFGYKYFPHTVEMSGFTCESTHDLEFFGYDVHILGYACNDQAGAFAVLLLGTLLIKLAQNKLWAEQSQKQRALLQLPPKKRWQNGMWNMLGLELLSTLIGIVSVLVIMGANAWLFLIIIAANLGGTAWTYTHMEMDHHSTATDLLNMLKLLDGGHECNPKEAQANARKAIEKLKEALGLSPLKVADAIKINNRVHKAGRFVL